MKTCPFCAEDIQDAAIVCKHCGRELAASVPPLPASHPAAPAVDPIRAKKKRPYGPVAVVVGFVMALASSAAAGLGFFLIWLGLAFTMSGGVIKRWGGGFLLALFITAIGVGIGGRTMPPNSTTSQPTTDTRLAESAATAAATAPAQPASAPLALLAARGYESETGSYHYVEGQVKNISDEALRNVAVVATWYDKDGNFIKADDTLIDYNPILPGQTSPFKSITTSNPAMSKYTVDFKTLMGGSLSFDDQRRGK